MRRIKQLIGLEPVGAEVPPIKGDYLERKGIAKRETPVSNEVFIHWRRESDKAVLGKISNVVMKIEPN